MISTPSSKEDHISQIPAIQFLVNLGYQYLTPEKALELRGGKTSNVLLEPILREQLTAINKISYRGKSYDYTDHNISSGIKSIKELQRYEDHIISRYKYQDEPEIIIVVDKLLTGFDAPKNTVLYITRSLRKHTLLQAIAKVNRVALVKIMAISSITTV